MNSPGLVTSSHLPGASMGDTTLWQGDPTVEGLLRIQVNLPSSIFSSDEKNSVKIPPQASPFTLSPIATTVKLDHN